MDHLVNLLFEAGMLKEIPRSGFHFLGAGRESIAEHSFVTTFICLVMSRMVPETDAERLMAMALLHDLPEARIGDLNYVQKQYVAADEEKAIAHMTRHLPMKDDFISLLEEFRKNETPEARLAHDADQLSLLLDLKALADIGYKPPDDWIPAVMKRLKTDIGKKLSKSIMEGKRDTWWRLTYREPPEHS